MSRKKMRIKMQILLAALSGFLYVWAGLALGGEVPKIFLPLMAAPESRLWLEGNSTLHPYSSTATQITASGKVGESEKGGFLPAAQAGKVEKFKFFVLVESLKSGKSKLDANMYKSLKAKEHPEIVFEMSRYEMNAASRTVEAYGTLSIAGVDKEVILRAVAKPAGDALKILGSHEILMTDFGIKPPSMMLGAIKTDNKVRIHFDLLLGLETPSKQSAENQKETK